MDSSTTLGTALELRAPATLVRVYENLPVMMYVVDATGVIVDVNRYWLKRLGYAEAEVVGQPSSKFMLAGDSNDRRTVWLKLQRGEDVEAWAVQYLDRSGQTVDGMLYGAPVLDGERQLRGAIATVFDVTPLRAAERARDRLEVELRLSQKLEAIGQLAAGIAHEINTPSQYVSDNLAFLHDATTQLLPLLAAVGPLIELAGRAGAAELATYRSLAQAADLDFVREEIPSAIQQSRDGIAQIKKIVLAMKEFSHPGADSKEAVDLNRAIEATVMVARNEWKYVADLELALDSALPTIAAVPSALNQVILNLVVNAAHAVGDVVGKNAGAKGKIRVATRLDGDAVEMSVADTGCGIAAENLTRIFDPFFTTKKVGKGTGQGLAIARRVVVDQHNGSIDVESRVGEGTCFRIRLPVASRAAEVAAA